MSRPYCMGQHTYDPESGWCTRCGCVRKDGRVITPAAKVLIPGDQPTTTPDHIRFQLEAPE